VTIDNLALFDYLCRLGDNTLILGHRLSEWCGVAPVLEEDIALANTALDLIGQTQLWLNLAGQIEQKGRSADDLAMLRDVWDFRNVLLVEQPNGDFGQTMMRQMLFDVWHKQYLSELQHASNADVADIATKAIKEVHYHAERSIEIVISLGDGTEESHTRMQRALDLLWPYVGELFIADEIDIAMHSAGIAPDSDQLQSSYLASTQQILTEATLIVPNGRFSHSGGKNGFRHSEHLGHLLTQMQWLQRAYPGASW
jgi:ring-1,2-phenylacetyl-CoA epoxidase subunit PaaC